MKPMLRVERLRAWYDRSQALFDVSFGVGAGEVLALLGPNGAGKSTSFKSIMGLVATQGTIEFQGRRIEALPTHERALLGIAYVPEDRHIFTELTVRENLLTGACAHRPGRWSEPALFELFPNLRTMLDRPASQMSGGEQQMLALARALIGNPTVVLLDEPSEGIAPLVVEAMVDAILAMKRAGIAVILAEQNTYFTEAVADRSIAIEGGCVVGM